MQINGKNMIIFIFSFLMTLAGIGFSAESIKINTLPMLTYDDQAVVSLLSQRIVRGLDRWDPYLFLDFIAQDYWEIIASQDTEKTIRPAVRSVILSREALITKSSSDDKTLSAGRKIHFQVGQISQQDSGFVCRITASDSTGSFRQAELYFEKVDNRWQLAGSSGFSALIQASKSRSWFGTNQENDGDYLSLLENSGSQRQNLADEKSKIPLTELRTAVVNDDGPITFADSNNRWNEAPGSMAAVNNTAMNCVAHSGIAELLQPVALARDDRGTRANLADDLLWVIDKSQRALLAFHARPSQSHSVLKYAPSGFRQLTALSIGQFNGHSDGNLFLLDAGNQRLYRYYFDGKNLILAGVFQGPANMHIDTISTDFWGNVYVVDRSSRQIHKFSADLEHLEARLIRDSALISDSDLHGGTGFYQAHRNEFRRNANQLLTIPDRFDVFRDVSEKAIGEFYIASIHLHRDLSELVVTGMLSEAAHLKIDLIPLSGNEAGVMLFNTWQNAGHFLIRWHRKVPENQSLLPGLYKLCYQVRSISDERMSDGETEAFYLPFFYYEDCGNPDYSSNKVFKGMPLSNTGFAPESTVIVDDQEIIYHFHDLNAHSGYQIKASFYAADNVVAQSLYAGAFLIQKPVKVKKLCRTGWLTIPASAVHNQTLVLRVVKEQGKGPASIAELWLREIPNEEYDHQFTDTDPMSARINPQENDL